jgi:c-di-GMP-binding flagellar brake protein YcgR
MDTGLVVAAVALENSERRRYPRYRYSAPIKVRFGNTPESQGMTVEISECGMSAVTNSPLQVGDLIEAEPIGGATASALVRRKFGRFYGFEFLNLSAEQTEKIRKMCTMLPLYRSKTLDLWQ